MKPRSFLALGTAALAATIVVIASAQTPPATGRAPFWPDLTSPTDFKVDEWYSDLPWHQKLGTYAGNQIDEAIIMPFDALPGDDRKHCADMKDKDKNPAPWSPARCMLEFGVNNILGMRRTDRLYDPTKDSTPTKPSVKDAADCKDATLPCIEVMLTVANYYYTKVGDGIDRVSRVFGSDQPPYPGYNITDGTTYAPQMPWYMSHYCDAMFTGGDFLDPVCYGDYFSTFNSGFNAWGVGGAAGWPTAVPWSAWPQAPNNHCAAGIKECSIVLAGFDLKPVTSAFDTLGLTYFDNNKLLLDWFNNALTNFPTDQGTAENKRRFPWSGKKVEWTDFYQLSAQNPFLGTYEPGTPGGQGTVNCFTTLTGPKTKEGADCAGQTLITRAAKTLYPRQCTLNDLAKGDAERLRKCSLNYEMHHNGWIQQWPEDFHSILGTGPGLASMIPANQYGRTSFLFAGVPGMQMPVSFYKNGSPSGLSIYEQVHNSSLFSLYIPIANEADTRRALKGRQYQGTEFYHTLLMTNHMEADPDVFAEGIRGKALWHNEYRMQGMYAMKSSKFPPYTFNAAFPESAKLPFHSNTCDSCHVRNGSGVPINTEGKLDALLTGMTTAKYEPRKDDDYTFTGVIRPMKLVLFDLGRNTARADASRFSEPLSFTPATLAQPPRALATDLYYSNAIMNFFGDSYHVTAGNSYKWSYGEASQESIVVKTERKNPEFQNVYTPWQVNVSAFTVGAPCEVKPVPRGVDAKTWPATCDDVTGEKIAKAIQGREVGYILLNGKRLGNSSSIEAMPNDAIKGFRRAQESSLGDAIAGELIWTEGTRGGISGKKQLECRTKSLADCFIGRFGWLGDRASLEDQVANAAFVEMNMTSSAGFKELYPNGKSTAPLRYLTPNCGPANKICGDATSGNTDLSELDIERMADYSRWIGNPTRSEFQVTLPEVVAGERVFRELKCNTCHVIDRINIVPEDTMLSAAYRNRLEKRVVKDGAGNPTIQPFLSYLGTDLLMHDMGYLSQVGLVPDDPNFRDPKTGVVDPKYQNYVQKIRTPALKGMRFNRFVTESYKNTKTTWNADQPNDPACDFLLHDGRACDAIEAAFLHDGPAIKALRVIEELTKPDRPAIDITNLRAFLYSL